MRASRPSPEPPADRPREPEAYGSSFFSAYAEKEVQRAQRYGRPFSLLLVGLEDPAGGDRTLSMRPLLAAAAQIARDVDVVAKISEQELCVLLPETDRFGALMARRRLLEAIEAEPGLRALPPGGTEGLLLGAAAHPRDGKDLGGLLARCRAMAQEDRASVARRLRAEKLSLWESVGRLLADEGSRPAASRTFVLTPGLLERVQREVAREIARSPGSRGLLFASAGAEALHGALPLLEPLPRAGSGWTIHLLGRRGSSSFFHPAVIPVYADAKDPICRHDLLLFLSDQVAYALVRETRGGPAFHTSDGPLVDHLVTCLQRTYDLGPY